MPPPTSADSEPEFIPSADNYVLPSRYPLPIPKSNALIVFPSVSASDQPFQKGSLHMIIVYLKSKIE